MAITRQPPRTIFLGGRRTEIGDLPASQAIQPGMLVERFSNSGVPTWRKHATASGNTAPAVATNMDMLNKGVDDLNNVGDLIEVSIGEKGSAWWMLLASGENVAAGDQLESAGTGFLRKKTSGTPLFTALEDKNNTAGPLAARLRAEVL
jgi:hypothetical protein